MRMNKKSISAFLTVIIFFLGVFFLVRHLSKNSVTITTSPPIVASPAVVSTIPANIKYVEIGGQKIKVDPALTEAEQTQGLSGRQNLLPDTGMLFVFNKPGYYPFWMPDMNFSIDMIWLTADMKVDYIEKNATPESYPAIFGPKDNNTLYVLEVPSGFANNNHLQIGDGVVFTY